MRSLLFLALVGCLSCTQNELGSSSQAGRTTPDADPSAASRGITDTTRKPTQPNTGNTGRSDEHLIKNYGGPTKTDEPERAE